MSWPAVSPDLFNPIENVWTLLKSGLRKKSVTGGNDELFNVLVEIWYSIDTIPLILSMRKRLLQVIYAEKGHTKYIDDIFIKVFYYWCKTRFSLFCSIF